MIGRMCGMKALHTVSCARKGGEEGFEVQDLAGDPTYSLHLCWFHTDTLRMTQKSRIMLRFGSKGSWMSLTVAWDGRIGCL